MPDYLFTSRTIQSPMHTNLSLVICKTVFVKHGERARTQCPVTIRAARLTENVLNNNSAEQSYRRNWRF